MNSGERDEILFKLKLISMRDNNQSIFGEPINSVGFLGQEYASLPSNFDLRQLLNFSDDQLSMFADSVGMSKAPSGAKSDVYINHKGVSLKSHSAAPAALVNHTSRPGFEFACQQANTRITTLDEIVSTYWKKRQAGIIAEDTKNTDPNCPFLSYKQYMKPILEYFLFTGTGSKVSNTQAQYLLEFCDPLNIGTCNKLTPSDAVDAVWPKLIFSLRAKKGMPANYNVNTYTGKNAASIALWVKYYSGDYRGALHIRESR